MKIIINQIFRYKRPYKIVPEFIDNLKNFFYVFNIPSKQTMNLTDAGITPIKCKDNKTIAAIFILSTPQKIGTNETPWQDILNPDMGYVRYFGDNKTSQDPHKSDGNKILLEEFKKHSNSSKEIRENAAPLILFENLEFNNKKKGYRKFLGIGIMNKISVVSQVNKQNESFTNYQFDISIMNLNKEFEQFDWQWIIERYEMNKSIKDIAFYAPNSWKNFISNGPSNLNNLSRRISSLQIVKKEKQIPAKDSNNLKCLNEIYRFYTTNKKKHNFELLASKVTKNILIENCKKYIDGWITQRGSDGGADFISRMDIGTSNLSIVKQVIYGQAKCTKINVPISGKDISRTVARLRRGWLGAFVTTSFFSDSLQNEVIEDEYPIMLICGLDLANEVLKMMRATGYKNVNDFLKYIDKDYESNILLRRPEEILKD